MAPGNNHLQPDHRDLQAERRKDLFPRDRHHRVQAVQDQPIGHCPDLSEHPPFFGNDGRGKHPGGAAGRKKVHSNADAAEIIEFLGLREWKNIPAREIPYGYQRRLEIARALATRPKLLLLDEPSCGMNEEETKSLMRDINRIKDRGCTILMVEHDMNVVMGLSDHIVVLNFGRKIAEGTPAEIQQELALVQEAYLGGE